MHAWHNHIQEEIRLYPKTHTRLKMINNAKHIRLTYITWMGWAGIATARQTSAYRFVFVHILVQLCINYAAASSAQSFLDKSCGKSSRAPSCCQYPIAITTISLWAYNILVPTHTHNMLYICLLFIRIAHIYTLAEIISDSEGDRAHKQRVMVIAIVSRALRVRSLRCGRRRFRPTVFDRPIGYLLVCQM